VLLATDILAISSVLFFACAARAAARRRSRVPPFNPPRRRKDHEPSKQELREGRAALVTGAGRGTPGRAIATALGNAGATVAIWRHRPGHPRAGPRGRRGIRGALPRPAMRRVRPASRFASMFRAIDEAFGTVHILVNNAALVPVQPEDEARRNKHYAYLTTPVPRQSLQFTSQMSDDEWMRYWGVNVHGVFYCTREALKRMEPQRYGRIVNIASIAGISAMSAHSPHYSSATKGAVIAFTKAVAAEVARANIFVRMPSRRVACSRMTLLGTSRRPAKRSAISCGRSFPLVGSALSKNTPRWPHTWRVSTISSARS
ncbi:SDR family NAD(P)-dependent oxidoreductase, partial [Cupriavidus basilensis]